MNRLFATVIPGIAAIAVATTAFSLYSNKPDYLKAAEERVSSYLTSSYGRVLCQSQKINDNAWAMNCLSSAKGTKFEFMIYPAERAPYSVARPYYIEAINDHAQQSADQGLMQYLQIKSKGSNSAS